MLRSTLLSRSSAEWQIGEELNFISTYIEMENLRFENKFNYSLKILPGTELTRLVPKLMVQAFVENAVRHGLMHRRSDCKLFVTVEQLSEYVKIEVEDNGIGRKASEELQRQHNGLGNEIIADYISFYNRSNKLKFKFTIEDLTSEEGSAAGTRVSIHIPVDFRTKSTRS